VFPSRTSDFASFLLTAFQTGANVIAIAAASGDTETAMKQAEEFGLNAKAKIVPLQSVLTDMRAVGLKIAQGAYEVSPFYWDRTAETRAWAERFYAKARMMPTGFHAGVYSSVSHYLKANRTEVEDFYRMFARFSINCQPDKVWDRDNRILRAMRALRVR
jgi:branched-chain amino acid transport system substrate-binding protein